MTNFKPLIMNNPFTKTLSFMALVPGLAACSHDNPEKPAEPNIVIIFLDDAGWADFQPFAEPATPRPTFGNLPEREKPFIIFTSPRPYVPLQGLHC
jgi:hypothetical protein